MTRFPPENRAFLRRNLAAGSIRPRISGLRIASPRRFSCPYLPIDWRAGMRELAHPECARCPFLFSAFGVSLRKTNSCRTPFLKSSPDVGGQLPEPQHQAEISQGRSRLGEFWGDAADALHPDGRSRYRLKSCGRPVRPYARCQPERLPPDAGGFPPARGQPAGEKAAGDVNGVRLEYGLRGVFGSR